MENEIHLLKSNNKKDQDDIDSMTEFYEYLQGNPPKGMISVRGYQPKMNAKKAMSIILYLQEYLPILPDHIEKCDTCNTLFDIDVEGTYVEKTGKHFCYYHEPLN